MQWGGWQEWRRERAGGAPLPPPPSLFDDDLPTGPAGRAAHHSQSAPSTVTTTTANGTAAPHRAAGVLQPGLFVPVPAAPRWGPLLARRVAVTHAAAHAPSAVNDDDADADAQRVGRRGQGKAGAHMASTGLSAAILVPSVAAASSSTSAAASSWLSTWLEPFMAVGPVTGNTVPFSVAFFENLIQSACAPTRTDTHVHTRPCANTHIHTYTDTHAHFLLDGKTQVCGPVCLRKGGLWWAQHSTKVV
jgi:hypothetical protein